MKILTYTDEKGYIRRSLVRDGDNSPEYGIPKDIPDLDELDWNEIKRELHNKLTEANLITWQDVQKAGNQMSGIVQSVMKRKLINLYKLEANNG